MNHSHAQLLAMKKYEKIVFVTGNENKVVEIKAALRSGGLGELADGLVIMDPELDEIQGDSEEVAQHKVRQAYRYMASLPDMKDLCERAKLLVLTEDTSLIFNAWGVLPGPYIKQFVQQVGPDRFNELLSGFSDKTAKAQTIIGAADKVDSAQLLIGQTDGSIVEARGSCQFGWDCAFEEATTGMTYGEMAPEEKMKVSHRAKSVAKLVEFLSS
eukprot:GHVH01011031.1.p1 GENE.GHVH01011031.1~~GHVH01011031.1.p1  ORF type:complete len:214 (+),score=38.14 GHVH01011031.1:56-697(+)